MERNGETGHHEIRAYPFQWIESQEDVYYKPASFPTEAEAAAVLNGVVGSLSAGNPLLDLTGTEDE